MPVVAAGVAFEAQGVVKVQKVSTFICLCRIRTTLLYLLDKGLGMLCKWFFWDKYMNMLTLFWYIVSDKCPVTCQASCF